MTAPSEHLFPREAHTGETLAPSEAAISDAGERDAIAASSTAISTQTSKTQVWLELLRISNYPTIFSNALTGCALGVAQDAAFPWRSFALAAPALLLIYAAGMVSNDVLDADADRRERPKRPIPSGRVKRSTAAVFACVAAALALGLLALAGVPALISGASLLACVALYNLTHKLHPASVFVMGTCRGLTIVTAACAAGWPPNSAWLIPVAAFLTKYVVSLSFIARHEAGNRKRIRVVIGMLCAISLLDAVFLSFLSRWPQAALAVVCFVCSLGAQRRVLGT